jgi:hypothetical protein
MDVSAHASALGIRIRDDALIDPLKDQDRPDEPAGDEARLLGVRGIT